jgi:hypothetical protein
MLLGLAMVLFPTPEHAARPGHAAPPVSVCALPEHAAIPGHAGLP